MILTAYTQKCLQRLKGELCSNSDLIRNPFSVSNAFDNLGCGQYIDFVLHLLLIRLETSNLCCISKYMMKHPRELY